MEQELIEACEGLLEILPECECDNTHKQNGTACRMCWARRVVAQTRDPEEQRMDAEDILHEMRKGKDNEE